MATDKEVKESAKQIVSLMWELFDGFMKKNKWRHTFKYAACRRDTKSYDRTK